MSNSFATLWAVAYQAPLSEDSPGKNNGVGLPFPSPQDLPDAGIEPGSPALQVGSLPLSLQGSPTYGFQKLLNSLSRVKLI